MKQGDRNKKVVHVFCDMCSDHTVVQTTNFTEANDELKKRGWKVSKHLGDWYDVCSDLECQAQFKREKGENNE